jgi:hypothetical protein
MKAAYLSRMRKSYCATTAACHFGVGRNMPFLTMNEVEPGTGTSWVYSASV